MTPHDDESFADFAEEFVEKHRKNGCSVSDFAEEHPLSSDMILNEFTTIAMLEEFLGAPQEKAAVPIKIGNYILEDEIGRGGMGVVYSALHPKLGNKIAVKLLPLHDKTDKQFTERFRVEAKICAELNHPNIVPVFDFGETSSHAYCTMKRIYGQDLKQVAGNMLHNNLENQSSDRSEARWNFIAHIGLQAAHALEYAHSNGVLHRDVKPSNLILDTNDNVWITDFGTAKLLDADTKLTMTGDLVGTIRYMAPEQIRGKSSSRSDVFGLGLTLAELIAAECGIDTDRLVDDNHGTVGPEIWKDNECIPKSLSHIVSKACEFDPNERYQTAAEMACVLQRFLDGDRKADRRKTGNSRRRSWRRKTTMAITLLIATLIGMIGYPTSQHVTLNSLVPTDDAWMGKAETDVPLTKEKTIQQWLDENPALTYVPESRKFFLLCEGEYVWKEAEELAHNPAVNSLNGIPGQLATIRTKKENEAAWKLAVEHGASVHLGASDADSPGFWHWHHQGRKYLFWQSIYKSLGFKTPNTEFINFAGDRPNNYPRNQHWLSLRYEDGKWRDIGAEEKLAYLVEWNEADLFARSSKQFTSTRSDRIQRLLEQNPRLSYVPDSKKFFLIRNGEHTWEQAKQLAQDPGINSLLNVPGELATIRTEQENKTAWELAKRFNTSVHLGGSDWARNGHWRWNHLGNQQDPFFLTIFGNIGIPSPGTDYVNFAPGRPNATSAPDNNWLALDLKDGKWRDIDDKEKNGYLIEWAEADVFAAPYSSHPEARESP